MEKRMEPVAVSTRNGSVYIKQGYDSSEDIIAVDPSQVPTLVQWLQEAVAEIELEERTTALTGEAASAR